MYFIHDIYSNNFVITEITARLSLHLFLSNYSRCFKLYIKYYSMYNCVFGISPYFLECNDILKFLPWVSSLIYISTLSHSENKCDITAYFMLDRVEICELLSCHTPANIKGAIETLSCMQRCVMASCSLSSQIKKCNLLLNKIAKHHILLSICLMAQC